MQKEKIKLDEVVIVEGKHDIIKLSSVIDAVIIKTDGFGIFSKPQKQELIRRIAKEKGIIVLTDSDGAGSLIRSHINSIADSKRITHLYIPKISGKERRKSSPSKEGYLGVEGIDEDYLYSLFEKYASSNTSICKRRVTKLDFYLDGFSGRENSKQKRDRLAKKMSLPDNMSADALICAINLLFSYNEYKELSDISDQ